MATVEPKEANKGPAPEGPDGGWGWVLVGALFVCNSLVFGLMRSSGIFFVEFVQYFDESAQSISWISSIGVATQQFISKWRLLWAQIDWMEAAVCEPPSWTSPFCVCFAGPLGSALSNAYETRVVVMTGGCLAGLGLICASQATSLVHLYLTMGVISGERSCLVTEFIISQLNPPPFAFTVTPGLGWGLVFTPMLATVMAHFTQRRTLALGISLSSVGLSSFAFNPLFQLLVEKYTWRGAILILGGLSLNLVPCGALIRPRRRSEAPVAVRDGLVVRGFGSIWRVEHFLFPLCSRTRPAAKSVPPGSRGSRPTWSCRCSWRGRTSPT